jgi:hypothetical protein
MRFMSVWLVASLVIVVLAIVAFTMINRGKPKE